MDTEKEMALRRFRRLQQIGRLLRYLEAAGVLLLISYSSSYIPSVARNSSAILRRAALVLTSPSLVFLLGNAIVLVLFAKSGNIVPSAESETAALSTADGSSDVSCEVSYPPPPHLREAEEVMYEDKEVCVETRAFPVILLEKSKAMNEETNIRRTEELVVSEIKHEPPVIKKKEIVAQNRADADDEEDAEQFRRTVEEFIAKQQRFQRQESLTVVPYSAGLQEPVAVYK